VEVYLLQTMEIEINNFRCYPKASFQIPTGITLLKGQSGKGKSTVLQALTWCLYGNIRGVEPNVGSKRSKLNVTIRTNINGKNCEIYRQKRPNLLRFKVDALEQVGDVAQAQIDDLFGSEEMWKLCCYLEQSLTNPLFRVSASEKMSLLNKVAFADSDPTVYIRKIEELLKEENVRFEVLNQTFKKECDDFKSFIDSQEIKPEDGRTSEEMKELYSEKETLEANLINQRQQQRQHHQSSATLELLETRISEIQTRLEKVGDTETSKVEISDIKHVLPLLRQHATLKASLETLLQKISELDVQLEEYSEIDTASKEELYTAQNLFDQYSVQSVKCDTLPIEYEAEAIEHHKEFLRCLFKIQPALKLHSQILQIHADLKELPAVVVEESTIKAQEEKIYSLKLGSNVLKCPSCSQNLLYKNRSLVESKYGVSTKEELEKAEAELTELKEQHKVVVQRKTLVDQFQHVSDMFKEEIGKVTAAEKEILGEYAKKYLQEKEIQDFQKQHSLIHSITYVERPETDIEQIRKGVQKAELLDLQEKLQSERESIDLKIEELKDNIGEHGTDSIDTLEERLQELSHLVKVEGELKTALERCLSAKAEHSTKINPGIDEEILASEKRLDNLRDILEKARVTNEAVRRQSSLKQHRLDVVAGSKRVYNLERLKAIAIEVECKILQQTVDSINSTINVLAESIFEDPIRVELKLYKKLKSKKTVKPGVNIEIHSKGGVYDSPNGMSGGEKDRLSLLLTLALNRLSGAPVVMLDEVFSSLDEATKEHCLRAVRSATLNKNVICVDHNGVEGYYEHVIDMGQ